MVHNGIEYGDMQLISEAYDVLRVVGGLTNEELGAVFGLDVTTPEFWQASIDIIGQRIAIHAGKTWDQDAVDLLELPIRPVDAPSDRATLAKLRDEGIIGTAVVCGVEQTEDLDVETLIAGKWPTSNLVDNVLDWLSGPYGWLLDDVRALPEPIPCKGRQGLWDVPPEIERRLS